MIKIVKQKTNFKEGDLMNIVINHPDLWNPISTGLSRTSDIDNLLNKIQSRYLNFKSRFRYIRLYILC
jgi:hypothetical protein